MSQGVLAKVFIQAAGEKNLTRLLLLCVAGLGLGRVAAMLTTSLVAVYAIMGAVIVALGVVNTAMAAAGSCDELSRHGNVKQSLTQQTSCRSQQCRVWRRRTK